MGKLLAASAAVGLSALFGTGHLFAQSVSAVLVQPDEAPALCQDVEPVSNGFGWNGRCSCTTGQPYKSFGHTLSASGSLLAVGASESPFTCTASGSVTIYEIRQDGTLSKDAEIYSSAPEVDDNFGARSKINNGLLAVSDGPLIRVYRKISNSWQQQYEIESNYGDFKFHLGELVVLDRNDMSRYQADNGVLLQTLSMPPPPAGDCTSAQYVFGRSFIFGEKYLAHETAYFHASTARNCGQGYYTTIYEQDGSGNYQLAFTYKGDTSTYVQFVGDVVAISQGVDLSNGIRYASWDVITYYKNSAGTWLQTRQAAPWGDNLLRKPVGEQMLYTRVRNDALVKSLLFYSFNAQNGWTLDQQLELPSQFGTIGTETQLSEEGDRLTLVNSYFPSNNGSTSFPNQGDPTVTVLQRSADGSWAKEYERTFEGDQLPILVARASTASHSFVPLNDGGFLSIARVTSNSESPNVDAGSTTDDSAGEQTDVSLVDNETADVDSEDTATNNEIVVSNTQDGSISNSLESSDESTSQSGGGSFWLPLLIFAVALRRPPHANKSDIDLLPN